MKYTKLVLLMGFLMILLVGCQQQAAKTTVNKAFVGGTQGLAISFLPGVPPSTIFDKNSPFQVGIKIQNIGEFDITNPSDIRAYITGINPADFGVSSSQLTMNSPEALNGVHLDASGNTVQGDSTTLQFPTMNYASTVSGSAPFTVRANVCYEYGTKAQASLCVRKDLTGASTDQGICNPNGAISVQSSGAPIGITSMQEEAAGAKEVDFYFTIQDLGASTDTLYKSNVGCDGVLTDQNWVYVNIADTSLGNLVCSGLQGGTATSGYVELYNNQAQVRCAQTVDNPNDFQKLIQISLGYEYQQYVDTQITINHAS